MMLKVFPDDDLGSMAHDRKKEQEKGINMTPTAMMPSILMLALLERGNVFVLRADTSRVGIGYQAETIPQPRYEKCIALQGGPALLEHPTIYEDLGKHLGQIACMHIPNSGLRGSTIVLFLASRNVNQKALP
ncbi:hypothetical protein BHE74_00043575 [Ensete ventricosum]|nr:hypothetical protein BHE74_00043575 [Ensete ventricosum]